jgi:hypothetical protein
MILCEPYIVLLAIICLPLSIETWNKLRNWLLVSCVINLFTAFIQKPLIDIGIVARKQYTPEDAVQGVFYLSGAGNYVSCSISFSVALYYLFYAKKAPMWQRVLWLAAAFYQMLISDSKQIIMTFLIAWGLLLVAKFKNVSKAIMYLIAFVIVMAAFLWTVQNLDIPGFGAIKYWMGRTHLYGPDGEAILTKTEGIKIILSHFNSDLNWLLGIGPGHTVGRLGGWVLRDYENMLLPLGATIHPASREAWNALNASWLAKESSLFVPMFSWAGIWGDLGFLGLGVYLYLGYLVWSRIARDDFSRYLLLTLFVYGLIITQMEEPAQTMVVAILIGLIWHEKQIKKRLQYLDAENIDTNPKSD